MGPHQGKKTLELPEPLCFGLFVHSRVLETNVVLSLPRQTDLRVSPPRAVYPRVCLICRPPWSLTRWWGGAPLGKSGARLN